MRVHELAKELKLTSKDLLAKLKTLKISAKSHASTIDAKDAERVRKSISTSPVSKTTPATKSVKATKAVTPKAPITKKRVSSSSSKSSTPKRSIPTLQTTIIQPRATKILQRTVRGTKRGAPPSLSATTIKPGSAKSPTVPQTPSLTNTDKSAAVTKEETVVIATDQVKMQKREISKGERKKLELGFPITVKDLAMRMDVKAIDLIKYLMDQGVFASIMHQLDEAVVIKAASAFNFEVIPEPTLEEQLLKANPANPEKMVLRAPVVTFMGHVDHGKTSLLDVIREAKVAEKEAGGITQHIGAYEVALEKGRVAFLDTPGHEAFSALRSRGANITDIVVLVVAADDGVKPQTIEAINHAKAANVPILVAINKIDRPDANAQKVMQQLTEYGLVGEEWGGKTIMIPVSAKTREGIDNLLEMLLLEAELLELKADPSTPAFGTVIEAKKLKDRGPVATLLVQQGTLHVTDLVVIGAYVGRVRAMIDDRGHRIREAGPSKPVEILGLPGVPQAGDKFLAVANEKVAKQLAEQRRNQLAHRSKGYQGHITLEDLHDRIAEGKLKELRMILKSDVQGSMEAIVESLHKLDTEKEEVRFKILHTAVGDINESDIVLAAASNAIIVGFHVGIDSRVQALAVTEGVDVHIYSIIYDLIDALKSAIEGLLEPIIEETFIGRAEVRKLFEVSKVGMVAGCMVTKGKIQRDCTARLIRGNERIFEGKLSNLKRVKDDAREVLEGVECGISLEGNIDVQIGDLIEAWELKKKNRTLD